MKEHVRAFAPANISLVFKAYKRKNPRMSGSWGVGFTLTEGVVVEVEKALKTQILFNGAQIHMPTISDVLQSITKEKILLRIETKLPLGCGFGISGATALAAAYAINKLLQLQIPKEELAAIAHTAEVRNKTGLGDVTNQFFGGFLFKGKPSSFFSVTQIPFTKKVVYCRVFGALSTKGVLKDRVLLQKINKVATKKLLAIKNILDKKTLFLEDIFSISKQFVVESGLLKNGEVKKTIEEIEKKGGHATMIILGNAVVSNIAFSGATRFSLSKKGAIVL